MRTLKFAAKAQQLKKDVSCDFSGLVKGSKGYLQAEFSFSEDYAGCGKIAVFRNQGEEYPVRLENNNCIIPEEALTWRTFQVCVVGVREGYRIRTNYVEVRQDD